MKDWFLEFSKTPLGTAICIGLFILVVVIYIFTQTSIGKKTLRNLKLRADIVDQDLKEHKESVKKDFDNEKQELKIELEKAKKELANFKEEVFSVLKLIPNKKVKNLIKDYEIKELSKISTEEEKSAK